MNTRSWFANGIEGRHVLAGLVVFFGVMFVANGFLVYFAVDTFSGGDRPDPYRSGLHYNDTIDESARQAARGWQTKVAYDNANGQVTLRFADKAGAPLTGLDLEAVLGRPATSAEDREIAFVERGGGLYAADVDLAPGGWVLSVAAGYGSEAAPVHRLKRRLSVADRS